MSEINIIGISGKAQHGKDLVCKIIQFFTSPFDRDFKTEFKINNNYSYPISLWEKKQFAGKLKEIVALLIGCKVEELEDNTFKNTKLGKEWDKWVVLAKYHPEHIEYFSTLEEAKDHCLRSPLPCEEPELVHLTPRDLLRIIGTEGLRNLVHPNVHVNALFAEYEIDSLNATEEVRLRSIFKNMNTRCTNPNYEKFHRYGGAGIRVCSEWSDFNVFKNWALHNGYTNDLSLDRRNGDEDYTPENCRWVTTAMQGFNKKSYTGAGSDFKGVSFKTENQKWVAQIQYKGEKVHIGYFTYEEDARKAYQDSYKTFERILLEECKYAQRSQKTAKWIIPDTRFENEAKAIKDRGGIVIRINNPRVESTNQHASETSLDNYENFDRIITNDGSIDDLVKKVKEMLIDFNLI